MGQYRFLVIGIFLAAVIAVTGAAAVASAGATGAPSVGAHKKATKKGSVKRKKAHRSTGVMKAPAAAASAAPDDRLTLQQVAELLKSPRRDLSGKNMSGLYLVGVNFATANLKGADLRRANLERADFGEANLERADLSEANLKMAGLRLSGIRAANLDRAILDGAVWTDGRVCAAGSVGQCREFAAPPPETAPK
jgi:hypothetical protein